MAGEERKTELRYENLIGGSGEIYSVQKNGKKRFFMTVEIDEERAKRYLKNPAEFVIKVDGSSEEWERERKIV